MPVASFHESLSRSGRKSQIIPTSWISPGLIHELKEQPYLSEATSTQVLAIRQVAGLMHEQSTFRANHCYVPSTHRCTDFSEVTLGSVLYCGRKKKQWRNSKKRQMGSIAQNCPETNQRKHCGF